MPCRPMEFRKFKDYHVVNKGKHGMDLFVLEEDYLKFRALLERIKGDRVFLHVYGLAKNHFHIVRNPLKHKMGRLGVDGVSGRSGP